MRAAFNELPVWDRELVEAEQEAGRKPEHGYDVLALRGKEKRRRRRRR
jgi:hypothetical protein